MALLFCSTSEDPDLWRTMLRQHLPDLEVRVWPDEVGDPSAIEVAIVWRPPPGALKGIGKPKAIFCLGAGIESMLGDPDLPADVPIVRLVDPTMTAAMSEFVIYWVLHFHRDFHRYADFQRDRVWHRFSQPETARRRVGILGLGELGQDAARKLLALGFPVAGWSRTPKRVDGVECFDGRDGLMQMLSGTNILVCLLPLTAATEGIIDRETLAALPEGAFVVNGARGGHYVETDLIAALDDGHIAGAALDVFAEEPLPADHPFWTHPKVAMTPHMAAFFVPESAGSVVAANIKRVLDGETPENLVDRTRGY